MIYVPIISDIVACRNTQMSYSENQQDTLE